MDEVNTVLARALTNNSGRYSFRGLSSGRFIVKVMPFGTSLEPQTQDVLISGRSISGRPLGANIQLDFYLKVKKRTGSKVNKVLFAQDVPSDAETKFKGAISDLDKKKTDAGIAGLNKALDIFPDYYLALERLGLAYLGQQKFDKALSIFGRAIAVNDRSFTGWYGLGYANYAMKNWDAAVENTEKAMTLDSSSLEASFLHGISLRQVARGKSPDVHWNLALLYAHNLNRYSDAAKELELYLKASKKVPNKSAIKKLIKQFKNKAKTSE
jgi:tetratricopeptide (TPR) repeat protein